MILQMLHGALHGFTRAVTGFGGVVYYAGNCRDGNTRQFCNIFDGSHYTSEICVRVSVYTISFAEKARWSKGWRSQLCDARQCFVDWSLAGKPRLRGVLPANLPDYRYLCFEFPPPAMLFLTLFTCR